MASIERTAYPRFKRFMSVREPHVFYTPQPDEIVWAGEAAGSDEHMLALVTQLKVFSRLGYFPVLDEVPVEVVGHIRRDLRLPETTMSRPHVRERMARLEGGTHGWDSADSYRHSVAGLAASCRLRGWRVASPRGEYGA
jgi:hypothetical protein